MYFIYNMALNPNFAFSTFNTFSCDSDEQLLSQKGTRKQKEEKKNKLPKRNKKQNTQTEN